MSTYKALSEAVSIGFTKEAGWKQSLIRKFKPRSTRMFSDPGLHGEILSMSGKPGIPQAMLRRQSRLQKRVALQKKRNPFIKETPSVRAPT